MLLGFGVTFGTVGPGVTLLVGPGVFVLQKLPVAQKTCPPVREVIISVNISIIPFELVTRNVIGTENALPLLISCQYEPSYVA